MSIESSEITKRPPGKAIYQLIAEARDREKLERRAETRYPFFRPVLIQQADGRQISAFSRDISERGIGLQHNLKLPLREVEITISSEQGYSVRVRTKIVWCRPCGDDWFVSGGEFIAVAAIGA